MFDETVKSVSQVDLLRETQELFDFIDKQKNIQLGMISLIQGIDTCNKDSKANNDLTSAIRCLTYELKNSVSSQNSIQANLTEAMKTMSTKCVSSQQDNIPIRCDKEVSCDQSECEDVATDCIPIIDSKEGYTTCDENCLKVQEDTSCTEAPYIDSCEDVQFKCKKSQCFEGYSSTALRIDFKQISRPNIYILCVDDFCRKINNEIEEWSEPFYTSHIGYRMCAKLGYSCRYVGIYVKLVKGDFDDLLSWPFKSEISFTLLNQINEENTITQVLKPHPCDLDECGYWIKPEFVDPCLGGWGLRDFVEKCDLLGPNGDFISDFIRNNRVYVKIKLCE